MERRRTTEIIVLDSRFIPRIMIIGLIIDSILIIFSVDTLFNQKRTIDLIITTALFTVMLLLIRRFNNEK